MTFEEFAATGLPALLRFAAVLAGDRATAEDLAQDVLIRAYSQWARIGHLDRPEPDHAQQHADREALLAELAKLPRRQRAVLVLRYYEGCTDTEIAGLLGCTPGTVRGYASRALAALRVELSPNQPACVEEKI
jgi:DNA-directed RNA polymerase specialized sigma24 family protein